MKLIKKTFQGRFGTVELEVIPGDRPELGEWAVHMDADAWVFDSPADIKRLAQEISDMLPQQGELS